MPHIVLKVACDILLVRDVLASDGGETYRIPALAAVPDLEATLRALGIGAVDTRITPAWRPPLPILIGRLRAARAQLERVVLLAGRREARVAGNALRPLGGAIALLTMAAVVTDQCAIDPRTSALDDIADQLQAVLDQIDALHPRELEVSVAGADVQLAIERLRMQAGAAPVDLRDAVVEWEATHPRTPAIVEIVA